MAAITASMVAELRGKTDAPMMECKRALTEAEGDMAKAEELLARQAWKQGRQSGWPCNSRRRGRQPYRWQRGALLEVNCETDFVTKNDSFLALAKAAQFDRQENPADVAALGALPYARWLWPDFGRRA
jgi:elongation factor Ts